jgi:hypothetical protein
LLLLLLLLWGGLVPFLADLLSICTGVMNVRLHVPPPHLALHPNTVKREADIEADALDCAPPPVLYG